MMNNNSSGGSKRKLRQEFVPREILWSGRLWRRLDGRNVPKDALPISSAVIPGTLIKVKKVYFYYRIFVN